MASREKLADEISRRRGKNLVGREARKSLREVNSYGRGIPEGAAPEDLGQGQGLDGHGRAGCRTEERSMSRRTYRPQVGDPAVR